MEQDIDVIMNLRMWDTGGSLKTRIKSAKIPKKVSINLA